MIKFFRQIRQNLLMENKTAKYFKYAIGEIILVVIGILIALSINNWNEKRKERALEQKLLENLVENLEQNTERLIIQIERINKDREADNLFLSIIDNNQSYNDSLEKYFHKALIIEAQNLKLSQVGYESLKDVGLEIIETDSMKKKIVSYFEENRRNYNNNLKWGDLDLIEREKFIDQHFAQSYGENLEIVIYKPFDPKNILKNNYFYALISKTVMQRTHFSEIMKEQLTETEKLIKIIKNKIKG